MVFGVVGSRNTVPGTLKGPLPRSAPTIVTSCTVVVLDPYMVRSAVSNGLLKVTVKPVAVAWKPPVGTTKPWTFTGALKPLIGGEVAAASLAMIVVPA